ncbi:MarR family winged helix-turn-helix transcriptional regulator [Microbacterium alcoholitolerans]|uniref:MarR family winged helix-turn-helix transcriptional regulator n=1 Tax=unclassified Microbacterium TaxID=2609290 RepID=UPI003D179ACF
MNNNDMNTTDSRPFGFWITAVDRLMKAEFATVFADEGISRREWRMLNLIDGTVTGGSAAGQLHGSKRRGFTLRRLIELGWIERSEDAEQGWALTEAGRLAKTRLSDAVDQIRAKVTAAVTDEEYTAMTASLEKIAREFGWEEGKRLPRRHGRRHGHARDFGHGHGCEHGHEHGRRFRRGHDGHGRDSGHGRGRDFEHGHEHGRDFGHGRGFGHGHGYGRRAVEHHVHIHTH